ncbi:DUF4132 domain-containing protein [Pseudomonas sp. GV071]|uniref:DUF4132 domain-containing protein n=1 Tax=Pseudomonas sp. GV071 TaxID=2135754 RepID=UPI000D3CBDFC|nr:DUF4132 domain-containing protein [Pseudomonas sp. GV071]PTQ73855.1 uncharacterized protein DUF4132 [Pseudomonas sp. GV071]
MTVIDTNSEAAFFDSLQQAYRDAGVGNDLDFAQVLAYWRGEAALPNAWRQALAKGIKLVREGDAYSRHFGPSNSAFYSWAFDQVPPEQHLDISERAVVLLTPVLEVVELSHWLLPTFIFRDNKQVRLRDDRQWLAVQYRVLQQRADALAEGQGDWLPVQRWYLAAGAHLQALSAVLKTVNDRSDQESTLPGLQALYTLLLVVREQLQRSDQSKQTWADLALRFFNDDTNRYDWRSVDTQLHDTLQRQIAKPLLHALVDSEVLARLVSEAADRNSVFVKLFRKQGLDCVLGEQPGRLLAIAEQVPDSVLAALPASKALDAACPVAALELEQVQHARLRGINASLSSPVALQWYRQLLSQEKKAGLTFQTCFSRLLEQSSDDEVDALIEAHYFHDADSEFPGSLYTCKNLQLLSRYLGGKAKRLATMAGHQLWQLTAVAQPGYHFQFPAPGDMKIDPQGWDAVMAASVDHPERIISSTVRAGDLLCGGDRIERWQFLWELTEDQEARGWVLRSACEALTYSSLRAQVFPYLERWYADEPELLEEQLADRYFNDHVDALLGYPISMGPLLIKLAAHSLEAEPASRRGNIRRFQRLKTADAIAAHPQVYAALDSKQQALLLPLFNSAGVLACADTLSKVLASSNKAMREPLIKLIARCNAEIIQHSGLLPGPAKARGNLLTGIAQSRDPAMAPLIAEYFHDAAHDEQSRGLSLDALERAGYPLAGLDPWHGLDLAALQKEAQTPAAVLPEGIWNEEFAAQLQPLGEPLGRLLLALTLKVERLPRRARQILANLTPAQRSDFALLCVERWIVEGGSNDFMWLLQPMREYGDERAANALAKAVQEWKKYRTQKAALAIAVLCELPGKYGCYLARQQWENGKVGNSIKTSASTALTAQAELRGLSLDEFLEVLAPDFGMGPQGLVLDVGPYSYTVRVRSDLSLVVLDAAGKVSKSLPKARAEEDPEKRAQADNQFKALSKNLKPVLKQQAQRLLRAMQLGQLWPASTWQGLFLEHPLLNLIAQNLVWSVIDAEEQPLQRVRPDASGGVVTLDDEAYALPEDSSVRVTHPLEVEASERAAWLAHFSDYELTSPIEQWTTPVQPPSSDELQASTVLRARGKVLTRGTLSGLLERWGYVKDTDGESEFTSHYWALDGDTWQVSVGHGPIPVSYFNADEQIELDELVVYRRVGEELQVQVLGELPPPLLNTVLVQAQALAEASL